jgi:hypothetical protein
MRRLSSVPYIALSILALAVPTKLSAQDAIKVGRHGLPYYGVTQAESAFADPKAYLEKQESAGSQTAGQREFDRVMSLCAPSARWLDVELYDGRFDPTVTTPFVLDHQPATAQLQWNLDLGLQPPNASAGNVSGKRWCTGTLIAPNQFLTAAHCLEPQDGREGYETPKRRITEGGNSTWTLFTAQELASLMHLNFNYQVNGSDPLQRTRTAITYPIVKLLEYGFGSPEQVDYAILEVGRNDDGKLPDEIFPPAQFDGSESALAAAQVLTILQHPQGAPKKVMAGPKKTLQNGYIYYNDLDTIAASSGSGILDEAGKVIGVHINGGCTADGGRGNRGVTMQAIKPVSHIIK